MCPDDDEERAYHPDAKRPNGLMCFKDHARCCGPDCMAFQLEKPPGPDYQGQWANCMILTNEHKSAKHLTIIAQAAGTLVKQEQDRVRGAQSPPSVHIPPAVPGTAVPGSGVFPGTVRAR